MIHISAMNYEGGIMLSDAYPCPCCHTMHFFFKNNGRTICIECNAKEVRYAAFPLSKQRDDDRTHVTVAKSGTHTNDGRITAA